MIAAPLVFEHWRWPSTDPDTAVC